MDDKTPGPRSIAVTVGPAGEVTIPDAFREALGLTAGEQVVVSLDGDTLRLRSRRTALQCARAIVRAHLPAGTDLVAELIAERRREAVREDGAATGDADQGRTISHIRLGRHARA